MLFEVAWQIVWFTRVPCTCTWPLVGAVTTVEAIPASQPLIYSIPLDVIPIAKMTQSTTSGSTAIIPNPRGYPPFEERLFNTYSDRQLRYYHQSGALIALDDLSKRLAARRAEKEALGWDGKSRENSPAPDAVIPNSLSYDDDGEPDSDYPEPIASRKGVKIDPSDITKFRPDSNISEFNSWLSNL